MNAYVAVDECRPSFFRGLWALTHRELKKWLNDPIMLAMLVLQPLIWMGLLGKSMNISGLFSPTNLNLPRQISIPGSLIIYPPGLTHVVIDGNAISQMLSEMGSRIMRDAFGVTDYFSFMAVGMISMIVVMSTIFSGVSIVWDRRLGFLEKVISTPVPRSAIIFAKILNATFRAMFQAIVILVLAYLLGLQLSNTFTLLNILGIYAAIFLLGTGFSAIFLAFSIKSTRMERPMQLINLIVMPLMFASNVFFPINLMPSWLQAVANVNPITYLTDIMRQLTILPLDQTRLMLDFIYLGAFTASSAVIGTMLAWKYLTI